MKTVEALQITKDDYEMPNRIRLYRKARGLTASSLATLIGVKKSTISDWELGSKMPDNNHKIKLEEILFATQQELFDMDTDSYRFDDYVYVGDLNEIDKIHVRLTANNCREIQKYK